MISINNLMWEICLDKNGLIQEGTFGSTYYTTQTILINKDICEQAKERTLLHEIVHAYTYSFGLINKESYSVEELCEFISHNMTNINEIYKSALKELEK